MTSKPLDLPAKCFTSKALRSSRHSAVSEFRTVCVVCLLPLLLLLLLPAAVQAQYKYTTNNNTITITGFTVWPTGAINIPSTLTGLPVTSIGGSGFYWTDLTSITIPASVTSIGDYVFGNCNYLKGIYFLGNAPSVVGSNVFWAWNYASNTASHDPATVYYLPCTTGWGTTFGGLSTTIWTGQSLIIVNVMANPPQGGSVTGSGTYPGCSSHQISANANSGWTFIGWSDGGAQTHTITVPATNITYMANFVQQSQQTTTPFIFRTNNAAITITGCHCTNGPVTIPETINGMPVISIGPAAFNECTNLTSVTIPDSVSSIGASAFWLCSSLTSVTIPTGVTSVGNNVFSFCSSLTNVALPSGVTNIGNYAFAFCSSLTGIMIPNSVTSIGSNAFSFCSSLTGVYFNGNAPSGGSNASIFSSDNNATVYYLPGTTGWGTVFGGRPTVELSLVTVNITANPLNGGIVSGSDSYLVGKNVQISATANSGWTFNGWSDGGAQTHTITVPSGGATYTASFTQNLPSTATISVQASPSNGGTVSGGGTYNVATSQQITAAANSGWTFTSWSDGGAQTHNITVPAGGVAYTATFTQNPLPTATISVVASPSNGGTVSGSGMYNIGMSQQISATANSGWTFISWSDGGAQTHDITVPAGGATYTANFSQQQSTNVEWSSPQDYVKITLESYQDKVACDSANNCGTYPTGSFTVNAVLFTGAGIAAASFNTNTPVEINIGGWSYQGANNTLSDDLKYKAKATRANLPLSYQDSNGKTKSAGTATLGFGRNNVTLSITAKAGQDAQGDSIQGFTAADTLTGNADPGKSTNVSDTVTGTITIGNYLESFTNIIITGTDAVKNSKARDGNTYPLDTVKIKGASQR